MARPKRPPHPMIARARRVLRTIAPELECAPLELHQLDGPASAPRFAVAVGRCTPGAACPHGIADPVQCPLPTCDLRRSLRLLFDADGNLVQVIDGHHRWASGTPDHQNAEW